MLPPALWWFPPAVALCAAPGLGNSADQNLGLSFKKLIIITKSEKAIFSYMSLELNSSNFILYGYWDEIVRHSNEINKVKC